MSRADRFARLLKALISERGSTLFLRDAVAWRVQGDLTAMLIGVRTRGGTHLLPGRAIRA